MRWRAGYNVVQLNVDMDPGLRDQFTARCKELGLTRKEVVTRLITGWLHGKLQLP